MLFYSQQITPRLEYIVNLICREILGIDCQITTDKDQFSKYSEPKINYSSLSFDDSFKIVPAGLLFEKGIRQLDMYVPVYKDMHVFFLTDLGSDIPFDPFSASFYMVTRYEEYVDFNEDEHGRFEADLSIAYENGFLNEPVVNQWTRELGEGLVNKFPELKIKKNKFHFIPTIDVDEPFAYLHKGIFRNAGAILNSYLKGNKKEGAKRFKVLIKKLEDPYFTFPFIKKTHDRFKLDPVFFILAGKRSKFDKNISLEKKGYRNLLLDLVKKYEIGVHPSYKSNSNIDILSGEINGLSLVLGKPVHISRQHFLKLRFPETYRNLIQFGIKEDYTMGYASRTGFRAGIASPFNFYDLEREEETGLKVFPFQVMDGTLKDYLRLEPPEAIQRIRELIEKVRKVNGTFISLWHNTSFDDKGEWKGWRKVYVEMIKLCVNE
ncbi:MAG: polysaccharide deacetylase family protein [Bacteroidales bacterium]|nr:polysaccharide deacetylase family protein [Bacteroidales bacterium]